MNIDIRLSLNFFDHPKTRKLQKRCGVEGVLCLLKLWMWAAEERPSGELLGLDGEDIELTAGWTGDERAFFNALNECRWIDEKDGVLSLHNWDTHQAYVVKSEERSEMAKKAAEVRWERERQKKGMQDACGTHTDGMQAACGNDAPFPLSHIPVNNPPIINNNIPPNQEKKTRKKRVTAPFVPPTFEEVQAFCNENAYQIDVQHFIDHYTANGWTKKGGSPVTDWKQCVRTWVSNEKRWSQERKPQKQPPSLQTALKEYPADFEEAWGHCAKKGNKEAAADIWEGLRNANKLPDTRLINFALDIQKDTIFRDLRFAPTFDEWLANGKWEEVSDGEMAFFKMKMRQERNEKEGVNV